MFIGRTLFVCCLFLYHDLFTMQPKTIQWKNLYTIFFVSVFLDFDTFDWTSSHRWKRAQNDGHFQFMHWFINTCPHEPKRKPFTLGQSILGHYKCIWPRLSTQPHHSNRSISISLSDHLSAINTNNQMVFDWARNTFHFNSMNNPHFGHSRNKFGVNNVEKF